jgi:hypothetical protein
MELVRPDVRDSQVVDEQLRRRARLHAFILEESIDRGWRCSAKSATHNPHVDVAAPSEPDPAGHRHRGRCQWKSWNFKNFRGRWTVLDSPGALVDRPFVRIKPVIDCRAK